MTNQTNQCDSPASADGTARKSGGGLRQPTAPDGRAEHPQLRVLHLEDNPGDAELIRAILKRAGLNCQIERAENRVQFETALGRGQFDLILSDYALPDYDGISALRLAQARLPDLPFILVSGTLGEELAVESLQNGATDYILKNRLLRLPAAVRRALEEAEARARSRRAEEELRWKTTLFEALVDSSLDGILVVNSQGQRVVQNEEFNRLLKIPAHLAAQQDDRERLEYVVNLTRFPRQFRERVAHLYAHPDETSRDEIEFEDGSVLDRYSAPVRGKDGRHYGRIWMFRDITGRKRAEAEVAALHRELVASSRQAGMAEVATNVLHNVGNVLNSVNVASHCLVEGLRKSKSASLAKVVNLLREHQTDLGDFIAHDPKGKMIPGYLAQLSDHLIGERSTALDELAHLQKNIEHIKDIVAMQQNFAKVSGLVEPIQLSDLLEDALRMNKTSLQRHQIAVVKEYAEVPAVSVEKHKVLQILINLIRNAQHACEESGRAERQITLRVHKVDDRISVSVNDNGVGIPPENLTRIFNHGFTTKKDGHGFGLHSGALAAREMGGTLRVHSAGAGHGATFTVELPLQPPGEATGNPGGRLS